MTLLCYASFIACDPNGQVHYQKRECSQALRVLQGLNRNPPEEYLKEVEVQLGQRTFRLTGYLTDCQPKCILEDSTQLIVDGARSCCFSKPEVANLNPYDSRNRGSMDDILRRLRRQHDESN
ncbi:MAG: hypothetical protein K0S07_303 [Chlamydiales bacterium]|jgi:hypothetical protein|nr:hypothetical protein [Chlamydiales bacterium]